MTLQDKLLATFDPMFASGALAGVATLVWRGGEVIQAGGFGWSDAEARTPMTRDSLFRIASMSKPITSVAAMILAEEGRFSLEDPISRWAPEFARMRVATEPSASLDFSEPATREITFLDLLTQRSGLTYEFLTPGPIAQAYEQALGGVIDSQVAPDDWITGLAAIPLIDQPGAGFHYGRSTDLLGLLLARIADRPLGEVLEERVFGPLGMSDTGFIVPVAKRDRCAQVYGFDEADHLAPKPMAHRPADMAYVSAGQGLWSTLDDYLAFARLFLGAGAVDGVRLLKPETTARMMQNQLTDAQRARATILGGPVFASHGFGLGVSVVGDESRPSPSLGGGGKGAVSWGGAFGGWWLADPSRDEVLVFLTHLLPEGRQMARGVGLGAYAARAQFEAVVRGLRG